MYFQDRSMQAKVKRFHILEVFPSGRVSYDNVSII